MTATRRKPKVPRRLYLISAADYLETAFFCGTAEECIEVLGMKSKECFYCAISKKTKVQNFWRIEKVEGMYAR